MANLLNAKPDEDAIVREGTALMSELVAQDNWLPPAFAADSPERYRQYLLHCDSLERFSVVSFVWGPGQSTPIHDHRIWGIIGMLRGAELSQAYRRDEQGHLLADGSPIRLEPGDVEFVSPQRGDIHKVSNALADKVSISIHVYGANIGRWPRATYDEAGIEKPFISGYSNETCPNIWGE